MTRALLFVSLVGCQAIFPYSGREDGGPGAIDAQPADTPVDLPITPDDLDGDGVPNLVDNCPANFNPSQGDEDQVDGGDACDLCPHIPNGPDNDDGDDLGNDCDPSATTECISLFEGFNLDLEGWTTMGGAWSISGGSAFQTQATGAVELLSIEDYSNPLVLARVQVLQALGEVGTWSSAADDRGTLVAIGNQAGMAELQIREATGATAARVFLDPVTPLGNASTVELFSQLTEGFAMVARATMDLADGTITAQRDDEPGKVGLHTRDSTARFHFVLVAEPRNGPCPPRVGR